MQNQAFEATWSHWEGRGRELVTIVCRILQDAPPPNLTFPCNVPTIYTHFLAMLGKYPLCRQTVRGGPSPTLNSYSSYRKECSRFIC